jgi:subtilase family serine protease
MFSGIERFRAVLSLCLVLLPLPSVFGQTNTGSQQAVRTVILNGAINPRARRKDDSGPLASTRMLPPLTLVLSRTPDQKAALSRFLGELQDPASPTYHKWLTPEQFGARFGSSTDTLNRVAEWLRSEGFTVQSPARGRGWIVFDGTVAQVQSAFHTEIHSYQVNAQAHFAPAVPPSVPEEFANLVAGIRGLDDFYLEAISRPQPMANLSNGTHALAPGDIAAIYGLMGEYTGNGQTIAVVGASDVNLPDIRQFRTMFQLSSNDPTKVLVGDDPGTVSEGLLEADSDLEWAGGVAPGATVLYVYGKDVIAAAQYAIDQNLAPILTFSFGSCEPGISSGDATVVQDLAQQGNAQGITWIAASGDGGAA